MSDIGRSMHDSLLGPPRTQKGKCQNCGSPLELYELDFKRSTKVMKCQRCGVIHLYKKDIIGKWKLIKAQKVELPPPR